MVDSFRCFGLVHGVTFRTSHMGKDKLYGVGKSKHALLAREGRKKNYLHFYMFWWFQWFRFGGFIPMFRVLVHAVKRIHMSNKVVVVIAVITIR